MSRIAVIDIGTNSIHMVLAEIPPDGGYKILDRFKDMTRLGDGTFRTHQLSEHAIKRGLDVIKNLVTLARNKGFDRIIAVATSAVREAKNGGDFVKLVLEQTGLKVRVVSGTEEARLIFQGVKNSIPLIDEPSLVVDVGGGSVELMIGNRTGLLHARSLKLGAIRLADQYLKRTPPTSTMLGLLEQTVTSQLQSAIDHFRTKPFHMLVATSGMAGNLAEVVHLRRTGRPLSQLNLTTISRKDVQEVEDELARSTLKTRLAIPGLDPKRADTLFPAAVVLRCVMECAGVDELTICDKAIREGVIYDFIERHRDKLEAEAKIPDLRRREVMALVRRCHGSETHAIHVAGLALRIFDLTKRLHKLKDTERTWLEFAALLHDVGYHINERQHHKHAYYLIKHSDIGGLSAGEIDVIANVARYHRRAIPQLKHEEFDELSQKLKRTVRILAAFLRIADALDRTHFSVVRTIDLKLGPTVTFTVHTSGDAEMETWAAKGRSDLFERVFRRRVQFEVVSDEEDAA